MTKTARAWSFTFLAVPLLAGYILAQNTVRTISGGGPNNLPVLKSSMGSPSGIALDNLGNVYVADLYSARVFKIDNTGNVSVAARNGARGSNSGLGDGGPVTSAMLENLNGVAVDSFGNIIVTDACVVREVSSQTGTISILAGTPPDANGIWRY